MSAEVAKVSHESFDSRRWLKLAGIAVVAWFLLSEAATEGWYRWKESQAPVTEPWTIDWPTKEDADERGFRSFEEREMGSVEQELLHFDSANSAAWRDSKGNQWTGFYLQWKPDKRLNQTDISHNPTSCFPAAGIKLVSSEPDITANIGGNPVTFLSWIFSTNGTPVYVFVATRRERELQRFVLTGNKTKKLIDKLSKPRFGNRSNPLQTLELVVIGPKSMDDARTRLAEEIANLQKP